MIPDAKSRTAQVLTPEAFAALGAPDVVYVRPVLAAEILASTPTGRIEGI